MIFREVTVGMLRTHCYIVGDEETRECAVFDPGASGEKIMETVRELGLTVKYIVLTHGHFDHVLGVPHIQEQTGAEVLIHRADEAMLHPEVAGRRAFTQAPYKMPKIGGYLEDGGSFRVGGLEFSVLNTPGHTPGSCVFLCGDVMLSGDTLFCESCGRCDLEGGDEAQMMRSLRRLAELPGNYRVYPGHEDFTTLDYERRCNPYMLEAVRR